MKRRDFLKAAVSVSGAPLIGSSLFATGCAFDRDGGSSGRQAALLPRREYGKTGIKLSIIGFPGFALKDLPMEDVHRCVSQSIERGMNYFDVAPSYGDAEQRLGPALEPHRKNVFLACKTNKRDRSGAEKDLKRSLELLRTDHFDLYQLHHITSVKDDVDVAFGRDGAMEVLREARKAGIVRYLGFSAHSIEAALTAMDRFDFDSALVPINFACYHKGNFGPQIVKAAQAKGVAILALKGMAHQQWVPGAADRQRFPRCWYQPITDRHIADLSLRFTLSQPVVAAIPPADVMLLPVAIDLAVNAKPVTPPEEDELKALAANLKPVFSHA